MEAGGPQACFVLLHSESFEHLALCPFLAICSLSLLLRVMLLHETFFRSNSEKSIGH